jgi:hypothetical protein
MLEETMVRRRFLGKFMEEKDIPKRFNLIALPETRNPSGFGWTSWQSAVNTCLQAGQIRRNRDEMVSKKRILRKGQLERQKY